MPRGCNVGTRNDGPGNLARRPDLLMRRLGGVELGTGETAEPGQQPLQKMLTGGKRDNNKFRSSKADDETARRHRVTYVTERWRFSCTIIQPN